MFFYLAILLYLLLSSLVRKNLILMWFNIFFLICIAGLRTINVGTDTHAYKDIYGWIESGTGDFIEPGWYLLNVIVQLLGGNFNSLLLIAATLTLVPIGLVSSRYGKNPSLCLFFYFSIFAYLQSFNIMRQMLAVSWVLLACTYLDRRLNFRFLIIIAVATTIHTSALIAVPLLWIHHFKLSNDRIKWMLFITFILGFLLSDTVFAFLAGPYASYVESGNFSRDNLMITYLQVVLMNILFYSIYYTSNLELRNTLPVKIFFIAVVIMNFTARLGLGSRIMLYFTIIQVILFPLYLSNNRIKNKGCTWLAVILYCFLIFMKLLIWDGNQVTPYRSIFSKDLL